MSASEAVFPLDSARNLGNAIEYLGSVSLICARSVSELVNVITYRKSTNRYMRGLMFLSLEAPNLILCRICGNRKTYFLFRFVGVMTK